MVRSKTSSNFRHGQTNCPCPSSSSLLDYLNLIPFHGLLFRTPLAPLTHQLSLSRISNHHLSKFSTPLARLFAIPTLLLGRFSAVTTQIQNRGNSLLQSLQSLHPTSINPIRNLKNILHNPNNPLRHLQRLIISIKPSRNSIRSIICKMLRPI